MLFRSGLPEPPAPIVWFTGLGLACLASGIIVLRWAEGHLDTVGATRRIFMATCVVSAVGTAVFAHAAGAAVGLGAVFVINGLAGPAARPLTDIWINRRTPSGVRATVHSLNSQAENLGEVVFGLALATAAGILSPTAVLMAAAALSLAAGTVVLGADDTATAPPAPLTS